MNFFQLKDISERSMELVNPTIPEKIITVGRVLGLERGSAGRRAASGRAAGGRAAVIDFGCGYGEALALWAEWFGITGVGIDIRPSACERARQKMVERGFDSRVEIVCQDAASYAFEPESFDAAVCLGASFIFGGVRQTIQAMRRAVCQGCKLAIGEPYWKRLPVPEEFARDQGEVHLEPELLQIAHQEGYDLEYVQRASQDDWDRYESDNWGGLLQWIEENPEHPERQQVIDHLRASQDEYFRFGREYLGWAIYVLSPAAGLSAAHRS